VSLSVEEWTKGRLFHAKFHPPWVQRFALAGRQTSDRSLSNLNKLTGLWGAPVLSVINWHKRQRAQYRRQWWYETLTYTQGTFPEALEPAANSIVCTDNTALLRDVFNQSFGDEQYIRFPARKCRTAASRCNQCVQQSRCTRNGETCTAVTSLQDLLWGGAQNQGRNHVFKVGGVQFLGIGYCTEQNTDGIPSFIHCSLQLRKKLGWSVQILGGPDSPTPLVVAPLHRTTWKLFVARKKSRNSSVNKMCLKGNRRKSLSDFENLYFTRINNPVAKQAEKIIT